MKDNLISDVIKYNKQRRYAFNNQLPFEKNQDFERLLNSRTHKVSRIKQRLIYLIVRHKYVWFCTFTINDNFINKSERTKRDYIKQYLNTHDFKYILNVDFGKNGTKRQHYHCILATDIDMDVNQFFQNALNNDYGWTLSIRCTFSNCGIERLVKYIDKLSNHCIKTTTQQKRLYYNFKGYEKFCPNSKTKTLQYKTEYNYLKIIVPLLDKGDITGNF